MHSEPYPDVLELWGVTWTREGEVWIGPAITDPEDPTLALSVEYQRIVRRDGRYGMVDPGITLDRFGWGPGDMTITWPDGAPRGDEEDADG
jgi:hypothetical protein